MSTTVQNLVDFSQPFVQYSPLSVGTALQPAIGIANEIQNTIMNPPFTWAWNRDENSATNTVAGTQDYTLSIVDFGFLEKVSLENTSTLEVFEVDNVYNNKALSPVTTNANKRARPNGVSVLLVNYGANLKIRFSCPADVVYQINLTYQKLVTPLVNLSSILPVPDQYLDIFNNLFVGECMALVDDAKANLYRQRGVAALLSKAEGLTDMQKNVFLEQYWMRAVGSSQAAAQAMQMGTQGRGV
jgi:hypothetical protein